MHPNYNRKIHGPWVPGYEGSYSVTEQGQVWSFRRKTPTVMTPADKKYKFVYFYSGSRKTRKRFQVHRAVLMAFRGLPGKGQEAMHLNGNPEDNRLANLAWGSKKENQSHRKIHGTNLASGNHPSSTITEEVAQLIWDDLVIGKTGRKEIAEKFKVSVAIVHGIAQGRTWQSVNRYGNPSKYVNHPFFVKCTTNIT